MSISSFNFALYSQGKLSAFKAPAHSPSSQSQSDRQACRSMVTRMFCLRAFVLGRHPIIRRICGSLRPRRAPWAKVRTRWNLIYHCSRQKPWPEWPQYENHSASLCIQSPAAARRAAMVLGFPWNASACQQSWPIKFECFFTATAEEQIGFNDCIGRSISLRLRTR